MYFQLSPEHDVPFTTQIRVPFFSTANDIVHEGLQLGCQASGTRTTQREQARVAHSLPHQSPRCFPGRFNPLSPASLKRCSRGMDQTDSAHEVQKMVHTLCLVATPEG